VVFYLLHLKIFLPIDPKILGNFIEAAFFEFYQRHIACEFFN